MFLGLLLAGCQGSPIGAVQPVDNTPQVCGEFRVLFDHYSYEEAPERTAYKEAMRAAYEGIGGQETASAARASYFQAWSRDLRPIAANASNPKLSTALNRASDNLDAVAEGKASAVADLNDVWQPILDICFQASLPAPTTG